MKTSELTGALLDYWVARAEGIAHKDIFWREHGDFWTWGHDYGYAPSTDWAQGGPIIERARITIAWQPMKGEWMAGMTSATMLEFRWCGQAEAPMVAAMRAYVTSKFGAEVPD